MSADITVHQTGAVELPIVPDRTAIAVWWAELDWTADAIASAWLQFPAEERNRADAFRQPLHRGRFIAARTCLRRILSAYVDVSPAEVMFEHGPQGKPRLGKHLSSQGVQFNLAHSAELAVFAVAIGRELGVDLERIRSDVDSLAVAQRTFTPEEQERLAVVRGDDRLRNFYRYWTCKEAYVKALGAGLSRPLDSFTISLGVGDPPSVSIYDQSAVRDCTLVDISPNPQFAAALAILDSTEAQPRVILNGSETGKAGQVCTQTIPDPAE